MKKKKKNFFCCSWPSGGGKTAVGVRREREREKSRASSCTGHGNFRLPLFPGFHMKKMHFFVPNVAFSPFRFWKVFFSAKGN